MSWETALRQEVKDITSKKAAELGKKARDELVKEYKYVLDHFYGEYSPRFYVRQHVLHQNYKPYYKNAHGSWVYGGVEFGSDFMASVYKASPQRVFDSFLNGFHGPEYMGIAAGISDPYYHMIRFRDILANNLL